MAGVQKLLFDEDLIQHSYCIVFILALDKL